MLSRFTIFIILVFCTAPSTFAQGELLRQSFTFDDRVRTYNLYVPSSYDPANAVPLTLNFHGLTGNGGGQMSTSGMNTVAEREGFLVAYPSALGGDWEVSNEDHSIGFTEALLDAIEAEFTIDSQRVYATGFSQGAIMSYVLASALPNRIAAIAPVSATRPLPAEPNRVPSFLANTPDRPFPLMHIHGNSDNLAPYLGGVSAIGKRFTFDPVMTILEEWVGTNGGRSLEQVTMIPGIDVDDDPVSLFECQGCGSYETASGNDLTAEVIHLRVNGGGHSWPALASDQIWNFFSRHELAASGTPVLVAGDADQNLDFDQLDLVQVQASAKYLTGLPATWGEGDWNGAPGGSQGNPPAGDGFFNQLDIISAQQTAAYLTGPYGAVQAAGQLSDGQTSIVYNANSGELFLDAPAGVELTSINVDSAAGIFTGVAALNLGGSFDNDADANIFKATFGGSFGSVSLGNVAEAGLAEDFLLSDLSVVGSLQGGGALGDVDLVYVPEPTSALLLGIGVAVGLLRIRRAH